MVDVAEEDREHLMPRQGEWGQQQPNAEAQEADGGASGVAACSAPEELACIKYKV